MLKYFMFGISVILIGAALACSSINSSATTTTAVPEGTPKPAVKLKPEDMKGKQTAVFAGGCFWGVEAVFEHVKGVADVRSGYSGGAAKTAKYDAVGSGETGHAESVEVVFDPAVVSYKDLLKVFFAVAHDPTELNRQGPDEGTQYRSAIFYANDEQKLAAKSYIDELTAAKTYSGPIVTQLTALDGILPGGGLSPGLPCSAPGRGVYKDQRHPEGQRPEKAIPGYLCREGRAV